jgi:hypothetical protein
MTTPSKTGREQWNLALLLLSTVVTAYLTGLIMVDLQLDLSFHQSLLATYYCELTGSLFSSFGIIRLFLPMVVSAFTNLALLSTAGRVEMRPSQFLVILSLGCIGLPLMGVSMLTCHKACSSGFDHESLGLILLDHIIMLALFVTVFFIQISALFQGFRVSTDRS